MLSETGNNGQIPLVLIPTRRSSCSCILTVPSGVTCLLQRYGKNMGEATPGMNFMPAWWRIAYVVSQQSNTYNAPVTTCPTSDNVHVDIDVVVIFRITNANDFIYKLGVSNFDEMLSGTVNESVRCLVRSKSHKDVYALRGDRAEKMLNMLNEKFLFAGVTFSDVKITSVWLPAALSSVLEATTTRFKSMDRITREHEYNILQINQDCDMAIEKISREKEQCLVTEAGRKKKAELEFDKRSVKAEEDGRVAAITAEMEAEVMILNATAQLNRTKTELEAWRIGELAKAEMEGLVIKTKGELAAEAKLIEANWEEEQMICEAEATKHEASAEKEASRSLIAKRKHELEMREKGILSKLAEVGRFNLVGASADRLIEAMLSGSLGIKTA